MNTKFGDRFRDERLKKGLTGEKIGSILKVSKTAISNWENGNRAPDYETLIKIADLFDVSTDYLLGRTDDRNSKVVETNIDGDNYKLEFDKNIPHDLSVEELNELIKRFEAVGFDIEKFKKQLRGEE